MYIQALIWFLVAFLVVTPVSSAPVVGLVAAFASTAIGSVIVNAAIGIALSIGASLLQNLFAKKSQSRDPGTTVQLRVGGANPLMFPAGRCATAGVRVYYGVWSDGGTPNEYMVDVLALSVIPIPGGMTGLWMGDKKVTVRTDLPKTQMGWPIQEYFKNGRHHAWVDFHDGTQTTVNPYLSARFGGHPNYPWTSNMIGRGVAYVTLTCRYDKDGLWQSGYPSILVETESIPLYDVRKDSSAGGSGPHRWGQFETYEPSNNAMVRAYNIARGVYYNDTWIYGGQNWPAYRLPASSWIAAMNACDDIVNGEPQFHGGGTIECDMEFATVIEELLRSSSALIAETGGRYKVRVGAPGAPVMSFTDDNIVVTREQGYEPFPGLESTYNIALITYTEPGERWSTKESPARRDEAAIISDDNRELPFSVDLPWVLSNLTAQRIGKTALENGRRFRQHSAHFPPLFWLLEPLDVVAWTSAHNGYVNKSFDVEQIGSSSSMMQAMIIRENDPSDYVWNPSTDPLPYEVVPVTPEITPPQIVTGWQVFPGIIKDDQGRDRRPSVEVRFDGALTDIDRVLIRVKLQDAPDDELIFDSSVSYPREPITTARILLNGDFPPNVQLEVQGEFVPFTDRPMTPSAWLPVTTPNVKLVAGLDFDPYGDIDLESLGNDVKGYLDWTGSGLREIERRLEEFDTLIADQDLGNETDRQSIRQQITATYEHSKAEWSYEVNLLAAEDVALAQRIETLTATVGDNTAAISSEATARANADAALASDITALDTAVFNPVTGLPAVSSAVSALQTYAGPDGTLADAITALSASSTPGEVSEANFRMQTLTGPSGYSRIGAQTRVGGDGGWRGAAWYLDTPNNAALPTRFVVDAEQFVITDTSANISYDPFIFQSGELTLRTMRAQTLKAARLQNLAGTSYIDMSTGTIDIRFG